MKKLSIIFMSLILLSACHTSRKISIAMDARTQEIIPLQSYVLPEGKVCFVSTTSYAASLPGMNAFGHEKSSNFVYPVNGLEISSRKSEKASIDTLIRSRFLTTSAMEAAVKKVKVAEKVCIPDYEYRDSDDVLELQQIIKDHHPDILINLNSLCFQVSGEREMQAYMLSYVPNRVYLTDPILPHNILSGDILISYSAEWGIVRASDMKAIKVIHQEGKIKTPFYRGFDLANELDKCAVKAGVDFSKLVARSK